MRPKWEKVGPFLWKTPVGCGWLYRDTREGANTYEFDYERRIGDKPLPEVRLEPPVTAAV